MKTSYFLVLVFLFVSCKNKHSDSVQERLEKAQYMIDQGQVNEAIQKLESDPELNSNPSVRVTLSSAYAARAGLVVKNYWRFFSKNQEFVLPVHLDMQKIADKKIKTEILTSYLLSQNNQLTAWVQKLNYLPRMNQKSRFDLRKAVSILPSATTPAIRLYRVFVVLVVVKSLVLDEVDQLTQEGQLKEQSLQKVLQIFNWIQFMTQDLKILYPLQSSEIQELEQALVFLKEKMSMQELVP